MGSAGDKRRAREAAAARVRKRLGAPGLKRAAEATIRKVTRSGGGGGGGSSRVTTVVTGAPASDPSKLGETVVTETLASGQTIQVTAQAGVEEAAIEQKLTELRTKAQQEYQLGVERADTFQREVGQQLSAKGYLTQGEIEALGARYNLTQEQQRSLQQDVGGAQQIPGQYTPVSPLTTTFFQQTQLRPMTPLTPAERQRVEREELVSKSPFFGTIALGAQRAEERVRESTFTARQPTVAEGLRAAPGGFARGVVASVADTTTGIARFAGAPVETTTQFGKDVITFGTAFATKPLATSTMVARGLQRQIQRDPFFVAGYGSGLVAESYAGAFALTRGSRLVGRVAQPAVGFTYRIGAERVPAEEIFATKQLREIAAGRTPGYPKLPPAETLRQAQATETVVTASRYLPGRTQEVRAGPSGLAGLEDPGLFTTPMGFGSPRFLRITGGAAGKKLKYPSLGITINPVGAFRSVRQEIAGAFTPARVAVIKDVKPARFPSEVVRERGFGGPKYKEFIDEQRETGQVFVTKRSELGQTSETELIVPAGERIVRQPTRKFTTIEGYPGYTVPVFEFKIKSARPLGRVGDVAEDISGTRRRTRQVSSGQRRRVEVSPIRPVSRRSRTSRRSSRFSSGFSSAFSGLSSAFSGTSSPFSGLSSGFSTVSSGFSGTSGAASGGSSPVSSTSSGFVSGFSGTSSFSRGTARVPSFSKIRIGDGDERIIKFKGVKVPKFRQPKAYIPTLRATVGGIRAPRKGAKTRQLTGLEERPLLF